MADGLYEIDALAWAEEQADLLRRLAAGERVNGAIDWPHVIEEVFDVGQAQLIGCRSLLRQAMIHLLKLYAFPESLSVQHWREETATFLVDAADRFTPSMRRRIDLAVEYGKALKLFNLGLDARGSTPRIPPRCPFTLDALLSAEIEVLLVAVQQSASGDTHD